MFILQMQGCETALTNSSVFLWLTGQNRSVTLQHQDLCCVHYKYSQAQQAGPLINQISSFTFLISTA